MFITWFDQSHAIFHLSDITMTTFLKGLWDSRQPKNVRFTDGAKRRGETDYIGANILAHLSRDSLSLD